MHGTEQALSSLLRLSMGDMSLLPDTRTRPLRLKTRFNTRKGIAGGAVFYENGLVRSLAKQQQSTSLSCSKHRKSQFLWPACICDPRLQSWKACFNASLFPSASWLDPDPPSVISFKPAGRWRAGPAKSFLFGGTSEISGPFLPQSVCLEVEKMKESLLESDSSYKCCMEWTLISPH